MSTFRCAVLQFELRARRGQCFVTPDHHRTIKLPAIAYPLNHASTRDTTSKTAARIITQLRAHTAEHHYRQHKTPIWQSGIRADTPTRSNSVPVNPANAALMVKAASFDTTRLKPSERQAICVHATLYARPSGIPQAANDNQVYTTSSNATR